MNEEVSSSRSRLPADGTSVHQPTARAVRRTRTDRVFNSLSIIVGDQCGVKGPSAEYFSVKPL